MNRFAPVLQIIAVVEIVALIPSLDLGYVISRRRRPGRNHITVLMRTTISLWDLLL